MQLNFPTPPYFHTKIYSTIQPAKKPQCRKKTETKCKSINSSSKQLSNTKAPPKLSPKGNYPHTAPNTVNSFHSPANKLCTRSNSCKRCNFPRKINTTPEPCCKNTRPRRPACTIRSLKSTPGKKGKLSPSSRKFCKAKCTNCRRLTSCKCRPGKCCSRAPDRPNWAGCTGCSTPRMSTKSSLSCSWSKLSRCCSSPTGNSSSSRGSKSTGSCCCSSKCRWSTEARSRNSRRCTSLCRFQCRRSTLKRRVSTCSCWIAKTFLWKGSSRRRCSGSRLRCSCLSRSG